MRFRFWRKEKELVVQFMPGRTKGPLMQEGNTCSQLRNEEARPVVHWAAIPHGRR